MNAMGEFLEVDQITVPWLDSALSGHFRRTHVVSFEHATLGHNEGFVASLYLLTIHFDNGTKCQVVAKFATNQEEAMNEFLFTTHRFHERECLCYGEIFPGLRLREVPIRYYQECNPETGRGVLLLEYLHNTITPRIFPTGLSVDQARNAVRALARLHAATELSRLATWKEDLADAIKQLDALGGFPGLLRVVYMDGLDTLNHYHAPLLADQHAKWGTIGQGALALADQIENIREDASRDGAITSICHGDIWSANLLFEDSNPSKLVAMIDWQCAAIGPALNDVAFLLVSSLSAETRQAHTDEILDAYCTALQEHGLTHVDLALIKDQYQANIPLAVAQAIGCPAWWSLTPDTPAEVRDEMVWRLRLMLHEALDLI